MGRALLIEFRDTKRVSKDGKYTQGRLMQIVRKMVARQNTTNDSNEEISNYIFNCFTINGILETYNQLGIIEWIIMIRQMVEIEMYERRSN